jgi:transcriptional regulator with XRE-family HTH domain
MPRAIDVTDPVDLYVGERLKAARLASGLSQTELSQAMKLSFQQVQKYERGTNRISASMLMRASKALRMPVADFFPDADFDPQAAASVDIRSLRGGAALAEYFATMDAAQRVVLLQVAQEFARSSKGKRVKGD